MRYLFQLATATNFFSSRHLNLGRLVVPLAYSQLLRMKVALEEQVGITESIVRNRVSLDKSEEDMVVVERCGQQEWVCTTNQVKNPIINSLQK